jgi:hypothetical protein
MRERVGQKASFAQVDAAQAHVNVVNFNISKLAGDIVKINQKVMLSYTMSWKKSRDA